MMDFMRSMESLDSSLKAIDDGQVIDRISHLEIRIKDDTWSDIVRSSALCGNLSMQCSKPVKFVTKSGKKISWWTNGVCHNEFGPSFLIQDDEGQVIRYTDENGYPHRLDGPASVTVYAAGSYDEEWYIHPGILHRVGGPAYIHLEAAEPHSMTWLQFRKLTNAGRYSHNDDAQLHAYRARAFKWSQNGRPKRENDGYVEILDNDIGVVEVITPSLIPRTTTYIARRTYKWRNEAGDLDRTDGPAVVTLHNMQTKESGHEKTHVLWGHWDVEWYHRGTRIGSYEIEQWMEKNRIKIKKKPPVEESAFEREDDEFCFLTDFLGQHSESPEF